MRLLKYGIPLALIALALSCATVKYPDVYPEVDLAVAAAKKEGLELENPIEIDDEIRDAIGRDVGRWGTPYDRVRRILRFMNDRGYLNFQYDKEVSITAREAYHTHRGNCMSYTNLFLGIARHLNIKVFFVHVNEATTFYERGGTFIVSSHMAIGYDSGDRITLVDLGGESDRLRVYERIDDLKGFILFYNNVAVEKMLDGDQAGAEKLLRFLVKLRPGMKETLNNLGVILIREGRHQEAMAIYKDLIVSAPDYHPAFTNGLTAARGSRDEALAKTFSDGARNISERDPFYLFNEGVKAFQSGDYQTAESLVKKALWYQPHNPLLHAWLAKVMLQTGRTDEGLREFKEAQDLAPNHKILAELRGLYPELAAVPPPPVPKK